MTRKGKIRIQPDSKVPIRLSRGKKITKYVNFEKFVRIFLEPNKINSYPDLDQACLQKTTFRHYVSSFSANQGAELYACKTACHLHKTYARMILNNCAEGRSL